MENGKELMWTPYKEFEALVQRAIRFSTPENFEELKTALAKYKQNFLTLLSNPTKSAEHRAEIEKVMREGSIPKPLWAEAIVISDMYDLDEYLALHLVGAAQEQMPNYPELPRGVVAALLYYDGRRALVSALKSLVHVRKGNQWTCEAPEPLIQHITNYTNELLRDGIMKKILVTFEGLDVNKEKELLQKNRALGPPLYQQNVTDMIVTTKQMLAEIVYLWSAQTGLPDRTIFDLLKLLRGMSSSRDCAFIESNTIILLSAFLYAIDLSVVQRELGEVSHVPLLEGDLLQTLQEAVTQSEPPWGSTGVHSVVLMGFANALAILAQFPHLKPGIQLTSPTTIIERNRDVFEFLHSRVFSNPMVQREEFIFKCYHTLMTGFITNMSHMVREMFREAGYTDRTTHSYMGQGLTPPTNLPRHFEHLLLAVAALYETDPLNLQFQKDYWRIPDSRRTMPFPYEDALFSFVAETSDSLPQTLFVPYLKMLASLSSSPPGAQQCYEFLKNNKTKTLTWNHFFESFHQYFNNLRKENLPTNDTVYRSRTFNKGISCLESEGLQAVLHLIKTVAESDPCLGEKMCENQHWSPIQVLLGLVACSVPIPLKASLLNTLAAFAKSPTTAAGLWHSIEASQIITTIPSTSAYQRGIQAELEEVECREERYPVTRAILRLFNALTDKPIPKLLGASQRVPGFDPYLNFVLNSVLLRFAGRGYKDPAEKWEVCEAAISLVSKLLLLYDPNKDDFLTKHVRAYSNGTAQVNPPPGYHIMISLCSKSELLRLLLLLVDEGCRVFDQQLSFKGKDSLEKSVLCALQMLEHGLAIERPFLSLLNTSSSPILLVGLHKLILGVNEITNKPDHLLNIAKYVTYQTSLPLHALPAVNVLLYVTSYPTPHGHLLSLFLTPPYDKTIRHGFVSCLDMDEDVTEDEEDADNQRIVTKTKVAICKFLLQTLNQGLPNAAHYLFGFDLNKEIRKTVLERPGVYGTPRSCLHAVVDLLNRFLCNPAEHSGSLVELYYKIIYALAFNSRTSEPTLRFLRSHGDFLNRHLAELPLLGQPNSSTHHFDYNRLRQMSWLLKTVAIEMKTIQQLSQLSTMIDTFTGTSKVNASDDTNRSLTNVERSKPNEPILSLIKLMKFSIDPVPSPKMEFINLDRLKKLMIDCEVDEGRHKLIDIPHLHILLENEFGAQNRTFSHHIQEDIQEALNYAIQLNTVSQMYSAMVLFFDSWRQVTEVMFAVANQKALDLEKRFNLLVEIIHELLIKADQFSKCPEIAILVSGTVLLLSVDLRQAYISEMGKGEETDSKLCNFMDSNHYKLTNILTNLIKWILSSVGSQKLRSHLYAALLSFLHLSREKLVLKFNGSKGNTTQLSLCAKMIEEMSYRFGPGVDVVLVHCDRLVEMLSHDSSTSHDICKMLALSCLNMIVELDPQTTWTSVLSSRGYLKCIINSLLEADKHLISVLSDNAKSLRWLYVYESKMALLCRIASTRIGAEMLLEQNTISCLATWQVFDKDPGIAIDQSAMDPDFFPNISSRYLQIVSPALILCDAVLTSMGVDNQMAVVQVLKFILGHEDMVMDVLKSVNPSHQLAYLKELSLLTGLIARTTCKEALSAVIEDGMDPGSYIDSSAKFRRIQSRMLELISRFDISVSLQKKPDIVITYLQIVAHSAMYVRNKISKGGTDRRIELGILQPTFTDSMITDRRDAFQQEATIGVVVKRLIEAEAHHRREKSNWEFLCRKLNSIAEGDMNVIKQYVSANDTLATDSGELRREATKAVASQVNQKRTELNLCIFIIEHLVYIIWAHLDYYMLRAISPKVFARPCSPPFGGQRMEFDVAWSVTKDDLDHVKRGLLSVFSTTFQSSLLATVHDSEAKEKCFLEALLKRILTLIQFSPN